MKRLVILAGLLLLVGGNAYAACWDCKFHMGVEFCKITTQGGFTECLVSGESCYLSGDICPPTALSSAPLASDFTVASVERIDGAKKAPQTAPQIARQIARLHTAH